jgi:diguanylate cyclase (GGDEF)-like protein
MTDRLVGLLCFTRQARTAFTQNQIDLADWAGGVMAEMIPRVVNQAVVLRQARLDGLTQLANRGSFDRQLETELQQASVAQAPCSLLLLDLDRFKSINDEHGHRGGDAVLRSVAVLISRCVQNVRAGDRDGGSHPFVARFGGEELAVLLPNLPCGAAVRLGESIRNRLEAHLIELDGKIIRVTTSVGAASFPEHGATPDELVAAADAALYRSKAAGRNRLTVAEPVSQAACEIATG